MLHEMDVSTFPEAIERGRRETLRFLASPAGERWRHRMAWVLIVGLPLALRMPGLRRRRLVRLIELAGGAAVLVKVGEAVRSWEPSQVG